MRNDLIKNDLIKNDLMKRFLIISMLLAALFMLPGFAYAADLALWFDGLPAARYQEEQPTDLGKPLLLADRAYVPLRLVAGVFGAEIDWLPGENAVWLGLSEGREIKLVIGSRQEVLNGKSTAFAQNDRVYVPLRMIAESFDCQVDYDQGRVEILPEGWELNGQRICGLARETHGTASTYIYMIASPYQARQLYELVMENRGAEVPEPELNGTQANYDSPKYYWCCNKFYLLTAESRFLNAWETDELYGVYEARVENTALDFAIYIVNGYPYGFDPEVLAEGYTRYILEMDGHWYTLPDWVGEQTNGFGWGSEPAATSNRDYA